MDIIGNDGVEQFKILKQELDMYSTSVSALPSLFVANKMDLSDDSDVLVQGIEEVVGMPVILVSAKYGYNIEKLKELILELYDNA